MTASEFKAWRKHLKLSQRAAAQALGLSEDTVFLYEAGRRRDNDKPVLIPKTVELACAALDAGITAYVAKP